MKALLTGVLALAALDLALSSGAGRVGGLLGTMSGWLARWMDPGVPLIGAPAPAAASTGTAAPGGTSLTLPPGSRAGTTQAAGTTTAGGRG